MKTLVTHYWTKYYNAVIYKCFLPFVVYFVSTQVYISNYVVEGVDVPDDFLLTAEFWLRIVSLALMSYFLYFEIRCIHRDGFSYLIDIFNYIDFCSIFLNIWLIFRATRGKHTYEEVESEADFDSGSAEAEVEDHNWVRTLATLAVILLWFKSFYWLRLFGNTSFFVKMIVQTLADIRYFLILFIFILMTFGNAIFILSSDRKEEIYKNYVDVGFLNVLLDQYELSLGEFNTELFLEPSDGGDTVAWLVFIAATMLT